MGFSRRFSVSVRSALVPSFPVSLQKDERKGDKGVRASVTFSFLSSLLPKRDGEGRNQGRTGALLSPFRSSACKEPGKEGTQDERNDAEK